MLDRGVRLALTAGFGALFLVALLVQVVSIAQSWGGWYWLPGAAFAVAACLLALGRRRRRAWSAVAGLAVAAAAGAASGVADLPQEPSPATALALAVLVGSASRALPPVPAGSIAAAGLAVVAGGQLAARPATSGITGVTGLTAVTLLAAVAAGLWLRLLDDRARTATENVRREERLELARELHDVVAHHLTGMLIQAQAAQLVGRKDPGKVADSLADIETCAADALTAMRRVVGLLRDAPGTLPASTSPGPEGLDALVERFNRQGRQGPQVALRMPDAPDDAQDGAPAWPPEVTSTVYRVVREALTNVLRHAPHAGSVAVTISQSARGVTVEVVDDAPPGPARPTHRGGYGLVGMRERVEALGGTLSAGPAPGPGAGWSVHATLPVPTREPR
ncbi:sensor histidine kinase [Streptomyces sp. 8K308]|uniref:sensor histidine kinase n=1 Tax=Streptomyces sp. 8K308 TaxID=2530388 RepID=UPI00104B5F8B|nr:histidine kinase [Streptomyces sp. 8K308]TDC15951.1 sensor histidine kinase [Streptomyces sp. 8K308]